MTGKKMWAAIFAQVFAFEIYAARRREPLLSEVVDEWLIKYPVRTRLAIFLLAAHLANLLREDVDVVSQKFFLWQRGYALYASRKQLRSAL